MKWLLPEKVGDRWRKMEDDPKVIRELIFLNVAQKRIDCRGEM